MKNIEARLLETGKRLGFKPPEMLLLLCQERFLARLGTLPEGKTFVWKGGSLVLRAYRNLDPPRYTTDIDFLVRSKIDEADEVIRRALAIDLDDGFKFGKITKSPMKRDTPYGGDRYEIDWRFKSKGQSDALRVDICAGDDVDAARLDKDDVFLWPDDAPELSLKVYPPEFIFAEKLQTAVQFGGGNTRLKDFIDMYGLTQFGLNKGKASAAIQRCFKRRNTPLEPAKLQDLLSDRDYAQVLEEARLRRYPKLKVPNVRQMFEAIATFVEALALQK